MKSKEKVFDAVLMMREIRDELSKMYNHDPSFSENSLKKIKKKYTARLEIKKNKKHIP